MKKLFFLSGCLVLLICCKTQQVDVVRSTGKEHNDSPPGTVWIKDSIYMDECEIRNLDYLEYVMWTKKHDSLNYSKVLPDSTVWREKNYYNEPYVHYYFTHPAYRNYPVVGISYEQTVDFCKWRTDRVIEFAQIIYKKSKHGNPYQKGKFHYRLPTKEEWEYAANAETNTPYGFQSLHTKNNFPCVNVREADQLGYLGLDVTVPVLYAKPNKFGLYNTIGNVAEMTINKGVSKGGSWRNSIEDCVISDSIKYDKPSSWLGFRCVAVVTK